MMRMFGSRSAPLTVNAASKKHIARNRQRLRNRKIIFCHVASAGSMPKRQDCQTLLRVEELMECILIALPERGSLPVRLRTGPNVILPVSARRARCGWDSRAPGPVIKPMRRLSRSLTTSSHEQAYLPYPTVGFCSLPYPTGTWRGQVASRWRQGAFYR